MRLYSRTGATAIDAPEGHFEPEDDGGFGSLPDAVFGRLHGSAVKGRKHWESETERSDRLHGEDMARKRDPASVHDALSELAVVTKQLAALQLAQAQANGVTVPVDPADEAAALKRRLAELEGGTPKGGPEAEAKPDPKSESKAPVKRGPASAKDTPAA
jgi:hypothetical protein